VDELMAQYRYVAYDRAGQRLAQVMAAGSVEQVKSALWEQGLYPVQIRKPVIPVLNLEAMFPSVIRVKRAEVIIFTRQLATFVRVGMPILEGLAVLRDQSGSKIMNRALGEMISDLSTGASLSAGMAKFPRIFSRLYVDMVRSAEVSGNLDDVLKQLASYMSRDESALRKVRNAMIYPAIVLTLALGVISVLVGFVLPAFARLFADFRAQMPLPTRILLTVGLFCHDHMLAIFATAAVIIIGSFAFAQTNRGRDTFDSLVLRTPVLGTIIRFSVVERYLRTLGTLAKAGIPISQMIDTANRSIGNAVFSKGLGAVRDDMLSGEGFAVPLERTRLFPKLVIQMIKVGEESGSLDANLEEAADHYAEEVDYRLKQMIAMMEPALVIVVGAMVGFIAVSVIAPMYSLVHAVH
jgi:type IV pilus assembly protein PilC